MMSGNKGDSAACSSKKLISAKGSRPERQGKKNRLLNMKEKGEVLPISVYDIVSAADMEDLIGERFAEPSAEDVIEEEHEEEGKEEKKSR